MLLTIRGDFFKKLSIILNSLLIILGIFLLIYQLNSFFNSDHNHDINKYENIHETKDPHGPHEHTH